MKKSEWISVEDGLPEVGVEVLAVTHTEDDERYRNIVRLDSIGMWDSMYGEEYLSTEITHWMRPPDPPESK